MNRKDRLTTDELNYIKILYNIGEKNNFIGFYCKELNTDISINELIKTITINEYLTNRYDFFMTINPHKSKGIQTLKEEFNYFKNQYLQFRYGKEYPNLSKEDYDIVFEQEDIEDDSSYFSYEYFGNKKYHKILNNHIHILWNNLTISEIWEIQAFLFYLFKKEYTQTTIYTKICNKTDVLPYMLKKGKTILYTQDNFKK